MDKEATRPAELSIAERQERRFRLLHKLYESVDGTTNSLVDLRALAEGVGLTPEDASNVAAYLAHEGLIQGSDWVVVTHEGIVEIEIALTKPDEPTPHFHANIADILKVAVGAGAANEGVAATPGLEQASPADIRALLDLIAGALDQIGLVGEMRREVVADIASARAQLGSPKPKASILREVLSSLHEVVEGAIGSGRAPAAAWAPILAQLGQLAGTFE